MSDGVAWSTVRLAIRNWIVTGAAPFLAASHVIWAGANSPIPDGMYITLDVTSEEDFGFDRNAFDADGTEHAIGDRLLELAVTVYGGLGTSDATLPRRVASRIRAAAYLTLASDALVAGGVGIMSWGKITTPGRGINSAVFEPRALFTVVLAVVSDVSVTGAAAGTTIATVDGSGDVSGVVNAVKIHQTIL